ncbi:kinase-like domain-containing protein [Auriculariales sp. MPI-PUGE-AT-0066]|nr:kinase-like domain-containing protein [Auriculariales sp. MPI-PUGE-AT-0066]
MSFARDLVRAVIFLQTQHGIVHTDIKPENVLVKLSSSSIWCLHLADFGSMWCVTRHPAYDGVVHSEWIPGRHIPRLSDKWTTGTLTYLPPETVETGYRGPGNDVWAFALTIIWVVCGTHQFARYDSDAMNQYAIVYEAVVLPQDLYWRYPVAFLDMLLGCLDKCVLTRLTVFDLLDHPGPRQPKAVTVPSVTATAPQSRPCFIAPVPFIGTDICQQVQQADYAFDHWLAFSPSDYTASPASAHLRRSSHSPNQRRLFKDHELADSP